ncbi:MAG TPA: CHAT domain-containing protein, partial [Bacteroidota bacterium]|nr:CHAT domain-containing protein [Bacteroidota bacterium]
ALLSGRPNNPSPVDFSRLPYLIRDFEISYQLSARLLEEHTQQEQLKHKPGFVAFAPVFAEKAPAGDNDYASSVERVTRSVTVDGKQFAELKESANEVNDIARLFAATKHPVKTYLYNAASETALKSDEAESAQFLHIATHGMINEDKPKLSALIFAAPARADAGGSRDRSDDGILYAGEVYNLKLGADLVVLSACESGLGKVSKGEGILGLTRGFLFAGAHNLVVSLWQVGDKSTADLMVQFYRNVLKGQRYGTALRNAKIALIDARQYAHPIEWSPFVLTGR